MPTVPRRDPASIEKLRPLPDVQYSPASATAETFGGGASQEKVGAAIKDLGDMGLKLAIHAQDSADKSIAQQYDIDAVKYKNTLMQEVSTKYRGSKSMGASEYVNQKWQEFVDVQKKTMPNDRVKELFDKRAILYYGQIDNHVQDHTTREITQLNKDTSIAERAVTIEDSAANWMKAQIQKDNEAKLEVNRLKKADDEGISADSVIYKKWEADDRSDQTKAKIERMLADGAEGHAEAYFKAHRKDLTSKEADQYDGYIKTQKASNERQKEAAQKQVFDNNFHDRLLLASEGKYSLTQAIVDYHAGILDDEGFSKLERRSIGPEYAGLTKTLKSEKAGGRKYPVSNIDAFNQVREMQRTMKSPDGQPLTVREIDNAIDDLVNEKLISRGAKGDEGYLLRYNQGLPPTEDDQRVITQANNIRATAERTIQNPNGKPEKVAAIVKNFHSKVDSQKLKGEAIDLAAKDILKETLKGAYPEVTRMEDVPHIIWSVKSGVHKIMNPDYKTTLKAPYKIVPTGSGIESNKKTDKPAEKK